ncbi:MAG: hypothetical protein A3F18_01270 [Legionellales bacterium RIFCSPHIGHO2_12_FULL_37_14]|nr:MAG: hypothetical protein A3F18_01270 [Legionellales bacterium RIFCSPHIGHO2_12_FULL_37_14]
MNKLPYKLVIFDWEGTLGDTFGKNMIPGALAFIERLKDSGVVLAIATNKYDFSLQNDLEHFAIASFFTVTRAANQAQPKPNPQMLEEILAFTNLQAKDALMIGDSDSDMIMAKSINIDAIGLDLSGHNTASLIAAGASAVFREYESISGYFFQGDGL